jgi:hypothetical protein
VNQPWICPRCERVCAPHVDYCDCSPVGNARSINIVVPAPIPFAPPLNPTVVSPYSPLHPSTIWVGPGWTPPWTNVWGAYGTGMATCKPDLIGLQPYYATVRSSAYLT